jgi:hypothetical protein
MAGRIGIFDWSRAQLAMINNAAVAQNWLATIALLVWPLVGLWLYKARPVGQATLLTILGGYLLLPVGASVKIAAGIPQLDKVSVPAITALIGWVLFTNRRVHFSNGFGFTEILCVMLLIGPLITSLLNQDPVLSGAVWLPGVGTYDGLSAIVTQFLFVAPFFIARQVLKTAVDVERILKVLVGAALLYSIPILFEIRMSPQLHNWLYGYFPSEFGQQMRYGGYRPVVFIGHGLPVAFFMMTATLAATALWRTRTRLRLFSPGGVTGYLGLVLILCKGAGSVIYGATIAPLIAFAKPRLQVRVAIILVSIAVLYPVLRIADLVPTNYLFALSASMDAERADSLEFRFDHEKQLLDRARERLIFGWGRFGRSRIYDEWGKDVAVSDGQWVLILGAFGLFGFIAEFGLLAWTVFRASAALRFVKSERDSIFLAGLALIVAVTMIDMLPNAACTQLTWLFAGALLGRAEDLRNSVRQRVKQNDTNSLMTSEAAFPAHAGAQARSRPVRIFRR